MSENKLKMPRNEKNVDLLELTAKVVANHLSNNAVDVKDIPGLIRQVYKTMEQLNGSNASLTPSARPAVPIKDSIKPDYIVCLEDGKRLKMLKRYLRTKYQLSPEDYKKRWGLPPDYPLVAPNYALKRQQLAKSIGLGRNK
ncbi:MAG: MucR family transcriptional regulator [Proteobacteria bacterium]|nr:MucR family transcriptional regulator [Pseudomonadota bacterium]